MKPIPAQSSPGLRFVSATAIALLWLASCSLITEGNLSDKPAEGAGAQGASGGQGGETSSGGGNETGGAGGGIGGVGGGGGCDDPEDCSGPDNTCAFKTCSNGNCGVELADVDTPCSEGGGEVCDGEGLCVKLAGTPCNIAGECLSGFCVDDVCCDGLCDGTCQSCLETDTGVASGTCLDVTADSDPADECANGACDGLGNCRLDPGQACNNADECLTNLCIDGVCCDTSCGGICLSCVQAETNQQDGMCAPVTTGGSDPACDPDGICDGAGSCAFCSYQGEGVFGNGAEDLEGNGVATDSSDAIVIVGTYKDVLNMGGAPLPDNGKFNALLAKYSSAGAHQWSLWFGNGAQDIQGNDVAIDSAGIIAVHGRYKGTLDLGLGGGDIVPTLPGKFGVFTAKVNSAGDATLWNKGAGNDLQDMTAGGVAVDGTGNVIVTGRYKDATDFYDGQTVPAQGAKFGVYLVKYDGATGSTAWSLGFGNAAQDQLPGGVAASTSGEVSVTGSYKADVDFGGGVVPNAAGNNGIFVAGFDGSGNHQWSQGFSNATGDQLGEDVAIDAAGNVIVVGSVLGTISVGGPNLLAPTSRHALVAKYDASGNHLWSYAYGNAVADSTASSVAVDANGNVLVSGRFGDVVDFGGGDLTANGEDAFVLKLSAAGEHICSFGYGNGSQITYAEGIAADSAGDLRIVGQYRDPVDFGSGTPTPSVGGKHDIYLLRYLH